MADDPHHRPAEGVLMLTVEKYGEARSETVTVHEEHTADGIKHRVRKQAIKVKGGMVEMWEEHEVYWCTPPVRVKEQA
jgi:hypothetical protein